MAEPSLEELICEEFGKALVAKWKDHGWWCPNCDLEAPPADGDTGPGWCSFCGWAASA